MLVAPITVLGSAAAALCLVWPAASQVLIRFTGPQLWWLLRIAHWAATLPGASITVPSGLAGVVIVSGGGLFLVALWRWRWWRISLKVSAGVLTAWSLAGVVAGVGGAVGGT